MSIGLAAVALLAIGVLGAVILVLAAHFLHVPEDERVGLVQACLPVQTAAHAAMRAAPTMQRRL